ncbi:hypothetical protein RUM43_007103 [Polyplax serrata]|uniref:Uncharacterized protein n=1 Tax=Polyplax serrata TaxID=468196 RepID=A0AAN8P5A9_POLSC
MRAFTPIDACCEMLGVTEPLTGTEAAAKRAKTGRKEATRGWEGNGRVGDSGTTGFFFVLLDSPNLRSEKKRYPPLAIPLGLETTKKISQENRMLQFPLETIHYNI